MTLANEKLAQVVDTICKRGCRQVNKVICNLEAGESVPDLRGYTPSEINLIKDELKAIMSVYQQKSSLKNHPENNI